MSKYSYCDYNHSIWIKGEPHGKWESPIIFECMAASILEADLLFENALNSGLIKLIPKNEKHAKKMLEMKGYKLEKMSHIGCSIKGE